MVVRAGVYSQANALRDLLMSLISLYSFVDVADDPDGTTGDLEDIIIRIAVQTIECGIFIQQYMSNQVSSLGFIR